jgi:hypothetical protein
MDKTRFAQLNALWLAGEKIDGLRFYHNSLVVVTLPTSVTKNGWIVAASLDGSEPVYTVEAEDGSGDIEYPESAIKSLEMEDR